MTIERRTPSLLVALLVGLLVLAGCGGDDDADAAGDVTGDGAAEGSAFPVTVEHKYGETTIAEAPERVAVVGLTEQDALLALGVVPIATTEWFGDHPGSIWPWAQDELEALGGTVPVSLGASSDGYNFEAVAAQDPDLILGIYSELTEADYEKLSRIAPTVAQPEGYVDYGVPWNELTSMVGEAVGKPDEAQALVAEVEAAFAAARAEHPEFDGASAVVAAPYEGIYLYGPEDARGRFLASLGFELPADLVEVTGEAFGGSISPEQAEYLDLDVVVWLDYADAEGQAGTELYESLPVHTEGREVHLDSFGTALGGATSFVTVLSLPFLLDELVARLAAAIDGDPTTDVPG